MILVSFLALWQASSVEYDVTVLSDFLEAKGVTSTGLVFGTPTSTEGNESRIAVWGATKKLSLSAKTWRHWEYGEWLNLRLPSDYMSKFVITGMSSSGTMIGSYSDPAFAPRAFPAAIADGLLLTVGFATQAEIEASYSWGPALLAINDDGIAVGNAIITPHGTQHGWPVFPIVLDTRRHEVWTPTLQDHTTMGFLYDVNRAGIAVGWNTYGHTGLVVDVKSKTVTSFSPAATSSGWFTEVLDDGRVVYKHGQRYHILSAPSDVVAPSSTLKIGGVQVSNVIDINNRGEMIIEGSRGPGTPKVYGLAHNDTFIDLRQYAPAGIRTAFINDQGLIVINSTNVLVLKPRVRTKD